MDKLKITRAHKAGCSKHSRTLKVVFSILTLVVLSSCGKVFTKGNDDVYNLKEVSKECSYVVKQVNFKDKTLTIDNVTSALRAVTVNVNHAEVLILNGKPFLYEIKPIGDTDKKSLILTEYVKNKPTDCVTQLDKE